MSTRQTILDAVVTALGAIDGVNSVSREFKTAEQMRPQDFPALFVLLQGEGQMRPTAYQHATAADMEAELPLVVAGMIYHNEGELETTLTTLLADVETALVGDSTLAGLTTAVRPANVAIDTESKDRYALFTFSVEIVYPYNHNSP